MHDIVLCHNQHVSIEMKRIYLKKKKFTMSNGLQTSYYQNNKIVCLAFRCQDFLEYVAFVPLGINIRAKETFR